MALYSKLVKCKYCGKNHKSKKERGKQKYICSTYDNYGKDKCERNLIEEEHLNFLIQHRFKMRGLEFNKEVVKSQIENIIISKEEIVINFYDDIPIIDKTNFTQF